MTDPKDAESKESIDRLLSKAKTPTVVKLLSFLLAVAALCLILSAAQLSMVGDFRGRFATIFNFYPYPAAALGLWTAYLAWATIRLRRSAVLAAPTSLVVFLVGSVCGIATLYFYATVFPMPFAAGAFGCLASLIGFAGWRALKESLAIRKRLREQGVFADF